MTVFVVESQIFTYLAKTKRSKRYIAIETDDLLAVLIPHRKIAALPRIWITQNDAPYSFFLHQRFAIIFIIVIHLPRLVLHGKRILCDMIKKYRIDYSFVNTMLCTWAIRKKY